MFYYIEPEVSGSLGEFTVMDTRYHPPRVEKLHYKFDGWLRDDLIESFPCFIITQSLMKELMKAQLSGFEVSEVKVSKSSQFMERHPEVHLPKFKWLQICGRAGKDDLGIADDNRLVISKRALNTLKKGCIANADIEDYKQPLGAD